MQAIDIIRDRIGPDPVTVGLVLGSGLGHLVQAVDGVAIDYAELPGFPQAGVSGHSPKLVAGTLEGARVIVLGGRAHYYEHGNAAVMRPALEALGDLGVNRLILTNAAGSLRPDVRPGDIMMLSDHINFSGLNPLIGEPSERRFVSMADAYDPAMRQALRASAEAEGVALAEGVYAWYSGPSFETPAEISCASDSRRRCGRHVDSARGDPRPPARDEGRGDFDHHQHGRRYERRGAQPRAHEGDGPAWRPKDRAGVAAIPRRGQLSAASREKG